MVLELIKIFEGAFGGAVLFENARYVSPNTQRRLAKLRNVHKYNNRRDAALALKEKVPTSYLAIFYTL